MKLTQIIAAAATAAVLGTAGVSIAGATTSGPSGSPAVTTKQDTATAGKAGHPRLRRLGRHAIGLSAKTIGISRADLVKEVRKGSTIGAVASAHGSTPEKVIDALVKAGTAKIEAAKKAGKISTTRAARLEERLPTVARRFVEQWHPKAKAA